MPITLMTKPEHNLIIISHRGEISDDEFRSFYEHFFQGSEFNPFMDILIDLRETNSRQRSSGILHQLARFVRERFRDVNTRRKVAVVAPGSLSFGLARMYQAFADSVPWDFAVFRTADDAFAWLSVPDDTI